MRRRRLRSGQGCGTADRLPSVRYGSTKQEAQVAILPTTSGGIALNFWDKDVSGYASNCYTQPPVDSREIR